MQTSPNVHNSAANAISQDPSPTIEPAVKRANRKPTPEGATYPLLLENGEATENENSLNQDNQVHQLAATPRRAGHA